MQVYKAIKYIRLSYTDDKSVESDSVANQRRLIDDFIARHPEIEVVAERLTTVTAVSSLTVQHFRK